MSLYADELVRKVEQVKHTQDGVDSGYGGSDTASTVLTATPLTAKAHRTRLSQDGLSGAQAQLKYNHDRHEISRSIAEAMQIANNLKDQATNVDWPMQVPLVDATARLVDNRPLLTRTSSLRDPDNEVVEVSPRRLALQRSRTVAPTVDEAPSMVQDDVSNLEVLSAECSQKLQVLRPEVMMSAHEENIIHTMNPVAVGKIMEQQFVKVQQHLRNLQTRVEDISSKVLVTGDLNAGKSTFCNALLRQRVLPEDQQPCTEVFCEVMDCRQNDDVMEVHAVHSNSTYSRDDGTSYEVSSHKQLSDLVLRSSDFSALKVYVEDHRSQQKSLLRNGVVDISLIDAPGLNSDSVQTTAVYSRQEEIDVVVFVVSAENHFTLSAKQFLWNAANEKAHIFIVVNKFDNIRDQDRCRRLVLDQISKLSPQTYANAEELVHFVSAHGVFDSNAKNAEAFDHLELSLRNFVLNKRSQSKLAPAKNFVTKFWSDSRAIASYNIDVATGESAKLEIELCNIDGKLSHLTADRQQALEQVTAYNEKVCESVRNHTREVISCKVQSLQDLEPACVYGGLWDCLAFANHLRDQYLKSVLSSTIEAELQCRLATTKGVEVIRTIGQTHLDESLYKLKPFNVNLMFSRKRDAIQRNLPVELDVLDFLDVARFETILGTSSLSAALVLYGGKTLGWSALVESAFRVMNSLGVERTPKLLAAFGAIAAAGLVFLVAQQVPCALQKNLAKKVQDRVHLTSYIENNANRISGECRKVLQTPENDLRMSFASILESEQRAKLSVQKRVFTTAATTDFFKRQQSVILREEKRLVSIQV